MSLKRQLQYKYQNFKFSVQTISLPNWLTHRGIRVSMLLLIFFFSGAYILNMTSSATSGYEMRVLEKQAQTLEMEVRKLEVEIADNSSMTSIASRLGQLNMVEASAINHLAAQHNSVAKN